MKHGIYYAYWEKEWGGDYLPYVKKAAELGFDILEISCAGLSEQGQEKLLTLKNAAEEAGITITGGYGPKFTENIASNDPAIRENAFRFWASTFRAMETAGIGLVGGGLYSYWPVQYGGALDKDGDWARSVEGMQQLADMAADILSDRAREVADALLSAYPDAPAIAQNMILDICVNAPGDERIFTYLVQKLRNDPEQRAMNAALLEKLGDERAIEPLKQMLTLFDLTYFDYLALRDAVESLGGDAGEERTFYGDPDYEALRNLQE